MRVYLHGNCQSVAMKHMLKEIYPDWEIMSCEVHTDEAVNHLEEYRAFRESADVIIMQPVRMGYRDRNDLSSDFIRETAKATAKILTYPSAFFRGHHPSIYYLRSKTVDIQSLSMPYHDIVLVKLFLLGIDPATIVATMVSDELLSPQFIASEFDTSLIELRRREEEEQLDIRLTPLIEKSGWTWQLFNSINHPSRIAMSYLVNQILGRLGMAQTVRPEGSDYLFEPYIPCVAAVARRLPDDASRPRMFKFWNDPHQHTPADYYAGTLRHLSEISTDALNDALTWSEQASYLSRAFADTSGNDALIGFAQKAALAAPS